MPSSRRSSQAFARNWHPEPSPNMCGPTTPSAGGWRRESAIASPSHARRNDEIGRDLERLLDAITQRSGDVVTLHPASIDRYAADGAHLAELAAKHADLTEPADMVDTLRRLVTDVVVHAAPGARGFTVEVKGRLAKQTRSEAFPSRSLGG